MKKRVFSAILTLCLLLTMMPTVAFAADDDEVDQSNSVLEGSCGAEGDNVTWNLTENDDPLYCVADDTTWRFYDDKNDKDGEKVQAYTLTIAGNGAMADYGRNTTPWGLNLA